MARYHVHLSWVGKGQQAGGAAGFHQYLTREGREDGAQFHRYLVREDDHHGKNDLVAEGHGHLPAWTQDSPAHFWAMADQLERKKGPVFFHLEIALPRELSPHGREALARDLCEVTVGRYPHSWAIHEPDAKDGSGIQPHVHIQFSSRREDTERGLSAAQWFKQPNHGGTAKDASWFHKARLYDVREAIAVLSNAALSREGIAAAVDHRTLKAQGLARPLASYDSPYNKQDKQRVLDYRQELRASGVHDYEQLHTYAGWRDQAVKLLSLERQYVKDLCRDHIWRHDQSPARVQERQAAMVRTLDLVMQERTPTHTRSHTPRRDLAHTRGQERSQAHDPTRQLEQATHRLQDLARSLGHDDEDHGGGAGLRVRIFDRERDDDHDRGMSW